MSLGNGEMRHLFLALLKDAINEDEVIPHESSIRVELELLQPSGLAFASPPSLRCFCCCEELMPTILLSQKYVSCLRVESTVSIECSSSGLLLVAAGFELC